MDFPVDSSDSDLFRALADRYAIERPIASGGMADVYLAADLRHGRPVAIKVLRMETMRAVDRERFSREISIAARLSHPNIVPLFDSGQVGPYLFYVMPYVEGSSLRERVASVERVSVDEAMAVFRDVGDALSYAHERGIVHRDIKPGNILLEAGHARVTDFGVAKAMAPAADDQLTTGQFAVGTLTYMSPEQANAPASVDARSDVYSLALVLYEMLGGRLPFTADGPAGILGEKALGRVMPLRELNPRVPARLEGVIVRALAPAPADRFASVADFLRAAHGDEASPPNRRRARRRYGVGVLIVATAVAAAVLARTVGGTNAVVDSATALSSLGRVVVVPLVNGTGDSSLSVVGLMAGDWLTEGLQKTGLLDVSPPPTVFEIDSLARQGNASSRTLAEETGARTVVSGAYYRRGDRLLFRVTVTDARANRVAETITDVESSVRDPISGLDELRNRLMGWLAVRYDERLQSAGGDDGRPPTYEAYRAFSQGMTEYVAGRNAAALPFFLRGYHIDTSFTPALLYATMALTNVIDFPRADSLLTILDQRRASLTEYDRAWLDFRLGIVRGNGELALSGIRAAARLAPASKATYNHAVAAYQNGYLHEARTGIEQLAPDRGPMRGFASYWSIYGSILHSLGEYDREAEIGARSRKTHPERLISFPQVLRPLAVRGDVKALDDTLAAARRLPNDPFYWDYGLLLTEAAEELRAHGHGESADRYFDQLRLWLEGRDSATVTRWRTVQALYALRRWDEARVRLSALRRADATNVEYLGMSGLIASHTGQRAVALAVADSLSARNTKGDLGYPRQYRARILALLGDREGALADLRDCLAKGRPYHLWIHRDPDLMMLRGYAPFDQIVRGRD